MTTETTTTDYWDPAPGDVLEGEVVEQTVADTRIAQNVPVVTIRTDAGDEVPIWCTRSVLRSEMARANPDTGDRIQVAYLGERTSRDGTDYHHYKVRNLTQPPPKLNWAAMQGDDADLYAPRTPKPGPDKPKPIADAIHEVRDQDEPF